MSAHASCAGSVGGLLKNAVLGSINKGRPFVANREEAGELNRSFRAFVDKATGRKKEAAA